MAEEIKMVCPVIKANIISLKDNINPGFSLKDLFKKKQLFLKMPVKR